MNIFWTLPVFRRDFQKATIRPDGITYRLDAQLTERLGDVSFCASYAGDTV